MNGITQGIIALISMLSFQENAISKSSWVESTSQADTILPAQVLQAFEQQKWKQTPKGLFFRKSAIDSIRHGIAEKDLLLTKGFLQLQKDANEILEKPILPYYLDEAKLRVPSVHQFASQAPILVMMYQITHLPQYAERCWKQFEAMAAYPDWGANRHFLDAGIGAFNAAILYDGLKDYLTPTQKAQIRKAVQKQVLDPALIPMQNRIWWHIAHHNWNGICNGGIIMACLAMMEADPTYYSRFVSLAANGLPYYLRSFEPDGQSEEGLMYWKYGLMYTTITLEAMQQSLGTSWGLDQFPGFTKAGWFPYHMSGPVTSLSIGDDPIKTTLTPSFFWFAKHYQNQALAQWQKQLLLKDGNIAWTEMLFYLSTQRLQSNPKTIDASKANYIHEIELMSIRSDASNDANFISMHGGRNNANHGHLDAGSFDIQAVGEVWAYGCLGRDEYTFPGYFSKTTKPGYWDASTQPDTPGRWHFYRLRAEGKNCLVFGPDARPDQAEQGTARLIEAGTSGSKLFYTLDLQDNYQREAKFYARTIGLDTTSLEMWVEDSFTLQKPIDTWWSMHTKAKIELESNNRRAKLTQNGKVLFAEIEGSPTLQFQILPASYLPGQSFPLTRNTENKGFHKLSIHQSNTQNGRWRIRFYTPPKIRQVRADSQNRLSLASIFQDHMVLQQNRPHLFFGYGSPSTRVTVSCDWYRPVQTTVNAEGRWSVNIPIPKIKRGNYKSHLVQILSQQDTLRLHDVLIGEVWLCSGQSNMDMTMQPARPWHEGVINHEREIKEAHHPNLRLLKVQKETSTEKREIFQGKWNRCSPESVADFSGVAYYFGRKLQESLDIPVGMIVAAYGSAACQAFIERSYLEKDTQLRSRYLDPYDRNPNDKIPVLRPMLIYNAMIHPLKNISVKGFLWYQGESNGGEYMLYPKLCNTLIQNWRDHFGGQSLPFYFVQMTPYNWKKTDTTAFDYALFREAQAEVLKSPHTGMVCTMDVGEPDNIHPNNKKPVGERLAQLALKNDYQVSMHGAESPSIQSTQTIGNKLLLRFQPSDCLPLRTSDGKLPQHFYLSADGKQFYPANVEIQNQQWILHSNSITEPRYIRYAFTNAAVTNVIGSNGLPLLPYRNDLSPAPSKQ